MAYVTIPYTISVFDSSGNLVEDLWSAIISVHEGDVSNIQVNHSYIFSSLSDAEDWLLAHIPSSKFYGVMDEALGSSQINAIQPLLPEYVIRRSQGYQELIPNRESNYVRMTFLDGSYMENRPAVNSLGNLQFEWLRYNSADGSLISQYGMTAWNPLFNYCQILVVDNLENPTDVRRIRVLYDTSTEKYSLRTDLNIRGEFYARAIKTVLDRDVEQDIPEAKVVQIPVVWVRPGDGKSLSSSFGINVSPASSSGGSSGGNSGGETGGGEDEGGGGGGHSF